MNRNYLRICVILLLAACTCFTTRVMADTVFPGDKIVLIEGGVATGLNLSVGSPSDGVTLTTIGDVSLPEPVTRFGRSGQKRRNYQLPKIAMVSRIGRGFIAIKRADGVAEADIEVLSVGQAYIKAIANRPDIYENALRASGPGYLVLDPTMIKEPTTGNDGTAAPLSSAVASSSSDTGVSMEIDDNGNVWYPRSLCFRTFAPFTRFGSGIVSWEISRPRNFHTLKDENTSSSLASSLRCPRPTGPSTDYYVDGVYSVLWTNPFRALKVPDHCTVTRRTSGSFVCCNSVMAAFYGTATFVNPRSPSLPDWPDNLRVCTLTEP